MFGPEITGKAAYPVLQQAGAAQYSHREIAVSSYIETKPRPNTTSGMQPSRHGFNDGLSSVEFERRELEKLSGV
jgi:hypothetical protein